MGAPHAHKFIVFAIFMPKNCIWWKYDKVLTKIILYSFLETLCSSGKSGPRDQAVLLFHNPYNPEHPYLKATYSTQMTSRNSYTTSRFSVPASAGPLLPLLCSRLK